MFLPNMRCTGRRSQWIDLSVGVRFKKNIEAITPCEMLIFHWMGSVRGLHIDKKCVPQMVSGQVQWCKSIELKLKHITSALKDLGLFT